MIPLRKILPLRMNGRKTQPMKMGSLPNLILHSVALNTGATDLVELLTHPVDFMASAFQINYI
jgi:hypothetical protein